jgi:hypothetical protein
LNFACTNRGATDSNTAFANIWSLFGGNGPKNITTWDGKPLYYYKWNCGWATDTKDTQGLLASANTANNWAGHGECGAFAHLLMDSVAANGISSDFTTATPLYGATSGFIIKDWYFVHATYAPDVYPFKFTPSTEPDNTPGMVPATPYGLNTWVYGDLIKMDTKIGQNTAPPSEEWFVSHYIVKYPHGGTVGAGTYYDPSYGVTDTNAFNFESVAVYGYCLSAGTGNPNDLKVKLAFLLNNMVFDKS